MSKPNSRSGVLLINLGTPQSPKPRDVRRYLRQFLSDRRVLDMNPVARQALLNLAILPLRPARAGAAYSKIWTAEGSPLLVHGKELRSAVASELGEDFVVELAMRYGSPSIESGLARLREARVGELILFPLFPQYSAAANGSALAEAFDQLAAGWDVPTVSTVGPFYDHPGFIDAFATAAEPELSTFHADHVLFSFHGLPERQIRRTVGAQTQCLANGDCCAALGSGNRDCYRAQCFATARALSTRLGLGSGQTSVAFQSRLGRTPWIQPFTDHVLDELPARGIKRLAVFCPSFVADCLETLEEIGIRGREQWQQAGGEELLLLPCPNAHSKWAAAVAQLVRQRGDASL